MTETSAKALLEAAGFVVVKAKSYQAAQRRQQIAESRREWAEREVEIHRQYAGSSHDEERRLAERLTFVYGVARARGATVEELYQP